MLAVTSNNETYLPSELDLARGFAESLGVGHLVVNTRELDNPNYSSNPTNRCYFCKSTLYSDLADLARERGYGCVVDGANADDEGDYRPGRKAAKELGVVSPLSLLGVGKDEVRRLAKHLGFAELGQAGAGVSLQPVSLRAGDHAGEVDPGGAGRRVSALPRLPADPRPAPR